MKQALDVSKDALRAAAPGAAPDFAALRRDFPTLDQTVHGRPRA